MPKYEDDQPMDVLLDIEEDDPQEKIDGNLRWDGQERGQEQESDRDADTSGDEIDPKVYLELKEISDIFNTKFRAMWA